MKPRLAYLPILLIISFFGLISCDKDDDDAKTRTDLISDRNWVFSSVRVGGTDVSSFVETCQKDNILDFSNDGTGTSDEGPTKCDPSDPQSSPFTWNFQNNETVLFISAPFFAGSNSTFNIVSLTETELVLSQDIDIFGTVQNAIVTFIH